MGDYIWLCLNSGAPSNVADECALQAPHNEGYTGWIPPGTGYPRIHCAAGSNGGRR